VPSQPETSDRAAKVMLVLLGLSWGLTWPAMRIALEEIPPFSMRAISLGLGAAALLIVMRMQGRRMGFGRRIDWLHIAVGSVLNIVGFTMLSAFALLMTSTSRAAILAYTMPIFAALFSWMVFGERLGAMKLIALALCTAGIAILIYPLAQHGVPLGLLLAVGIGLTWAAGTVYVKWARIDGDPIAIAAWQLAFGWAIVVACLPLAEGGLQIAHAHAKAILCTMFVGLIGSAFAYVLWFRIIGRLSATTASLGILSVPAIGVVASAVLLGERPTVPDIVGFALIFAASACVLLSPGDKAAQAS